MNPCGVETLDPFKRRRRTRSQRRRRIVAFLCGKRNVAPNAWGINCYTDKKTVWTNTLQSQIFGDSSLSPLWMSREEPGWVDALRGTLALRRRGPRRRPTGSGGRASSEPLAGVGDGRCRSPCSHSGPLVSLVSTASTSDTGC